MLKIAVALHVAAAIVHLVLAYWSVRRARAMATRAVAIGRSVECAAEEALRSAAREIVYRKLLADANTQVKFEFPPRVGTQAQDVRVTVTRVTP